MIKDKTKNISNSLYKLKYEKDINDNKNYILWLIDKLIIIIFLKKKLINSPFNIE